MSNWKKNFSHYLAWTIHIIINQFNSWLFCYLLDKY